MNSQCLAKKRLGGRAVCIAAGGKLLEITDGGGVVDIRGNILRVELGAVGAKPGDYVLVHAGCAIAVADKAEVEELDGLLDLLESYSDGR